MSSLPVLIETFCGVRFMIRSCLAVQLTVWGVSAASVAGSGPVDLQTSSNSQANVECCDRIPLVVPENVIRAEKDASSGRLAMEVANRQGRSTDYRCRNREPGSQQPNRRAARSDLPLQAASFS